MNSPVKQIALPYGTGSVTIAVPTHNLIGVFASRVEEYQPKASEDELVRMALDQPIGSKTLETLSGGCRKVVIIASDHTRPVPSRVIMPQILERIRRGNPQAEITIVIATGNHRPSTREELVRKFGEKIVAEEEIVMHRSSNRENMATLGVLPSGGQLKLNRLVVEADLVVAEGFIEPHMFAGFSGGRKSVLPGIAAKETVLANHCSEFIQSPQSVTGNLENNPIHEDMLYAADVAKLAFIVNVVINEDKKVIYAVSGGHRTAHLAGCKFLSTLCGVPRTDAEIVITSNGGSPMDQNVYQAVKGMSTAALAGSEDSVIIIFAACDDGHGGEDFYRSLSEAASPDEVLETVLKIPRDQTKPDQWEYQILASILRNHTVILITERSNREMVCKMKLEQADNFREAWERALQIKGKNAKTSVIPNGIAVVPEK